MEVEEIEIVMIDPDLDPKIANVEEKDLGQDPGIEVNAKEVEDQDRETENGVDQDQKKRKGAEDHDLAPGRWRESAGSPRPQ